MFGTKTPKLTAEIQDRVLTALRAGNYSYIAAEYAGISERTLRRWLQMGQEAKRGQYREFWLAVQKAERDAEVRAVAMMHKHMDEHWQAAMAYLERRYPERWARQDRLTIDVDPHEVVRDLLAISDQELDLAVEATAHGAE